MTKMEVRTSLGEDMLYVKICGCEKSWDAQARVRHLKRLELREHWAA